MNIQKHHLFRIIIASIVITILIFSSWVVSKLNPFLVMYKKGLHENATFLALNICPETECATNLGWGTRKLFIDSSKKIFQRWCVEVIYKNKLTREKDKVALEIILTDKDADNPSNWEIVNTKYESDCASMK